MIQSLIRTQSKKLVSVGKFSTSVESPKVTIIKNALLLKKIEEAHDEEALKKVLSSPLPTVDSNNLPAELQNWNTYVSLSTSASDDKYIPDSNAWQNKPNLDLIKAEFSRKEFWPLIIGFALSFVFFGPWLKSKIPESRLEKSDYRKLILGSGDHHHH